VLFHKKPTEDTIMSELEKGNFKANINSLVKGFIEGKECLMHCHLVKSENGLGRSTVIDLGAKGDNKFR
jgi:hypothetical protein